MQYYGNETKLGAQIPFNFGFVKIDKNHIVDNVDICIKRWLNHIPKNMVANWVVRLSILIWLKTKVPTYCAWADQNFMLE